jgi:hypothetical protein
MFRMIAPHVGMALLTAVYTLAGAMVFYTIEAPNEKLLREHCIEEVCSHPQISTKAYTDPPNPKSSHRPPVEHVPTGR